MLISFILFYRYWRLAKQVWATMLGTYLQGCRNTENFKRKKKSHRALKTSNRARNVAQQ